MKTSDIVEVTKLVEFFCTYTAAVLLSLSSNIKTVKSLALLVVSFVLSFVDTAGLALYRRHERHEKMAKAKDLLEIHGKNVAFARAHLPDPCNEDTPRNVLRNNLRQDLLGAGRHISKTDITGLEFLNDVQNAQLIEERCMAFMAIAVSAYSTECSHLGDPTYASDLAAYKKKLLKSSRDQREMFDIDAWPDNDAQPNTASTTTPNA
ncbi:hypothetical protein EV421DRAFT_999558 [Armillaria borealis]|uniref:Uncharacterized protein n=1 Tax=Armillaria borealis TaxID=47425 RepID=A0AA39J816_9AGAR|nr:hypothetical protein EV421DRAFT_999558 [Armillaria borealis]